MPSNHSNFFYFFFSLLPVVKLSLLILLVGRAITIWEAIQKRSHEPIYKKNLSREIKSDNFCYRKNRRAITKWGAIEKSKKRVTKIISHYDGSNNIFADCSVVMLQKGFVHFQMILAIYLIKNIHIHVQYMYVLMYFFFNLDCRLNVDISFHIPIPTKYFCILMLASFRQKNGFYIWHQINIEF